MKTLTETRGGARWGGVESTNVRRDLVLPLPFSAAFVSPLIAFFVSGLKFATVNLMSSDSTRLRDLMTHLHLVWSAPTQIVVILTLLFLTVGVSAIAGLIVLVALVPTTAWITRKLTVIRKGACVACVACVCGGRGSGCVCVCVRWTGEGVCGWGALQAIRVV